MGNDCTRIALPREDWLSKHDAWTVRYALVTASWHKGHVLGSGHRLALCEFGSRLLQ